jgi:hypothetical protein
MHLYDHPQERWKRERGDQERKEPQRPAKEIEIMKYVLVS